MASSLRPRQWTKNLIIFFALLFTVGEAWSPADLGDAAPLVLDAVLAFVLFCVLSSAAYLLNDVADAERDSAHPEKRLRPVASGALPAGLAAASGVILTALAVSLSFLLETDFGWAALGYALLMASYSFVLKRVPLIDVFVIAAGFVGRAAAGAVVLGVPISPWLYLCTGLGALVIGLGKRRSELGSAGDDAASQRDSLSGYSVRLIDRLVYLVAPGTLAAYILYALTAENLPDNYMMGLTVPFVAYGLARYLYLVNVRGLGETPEELLVSDSHLIVTVILWLVTSSLVLALLRT